MVMCDASDIKGCDRRRPELYNAPLHMKQEVSSIEQLQLFINPPKFKLTCICLMAQNAVQGAGRRAGVEVYVATKGKVATVPVLRSDLGVDQKDGLLLA
tara:strand:+ start:285 stop:581 length:297 start_codon:yes stop_codon:yes gene_type:complete